MSDIEILNNLKKVYPYDIDEINKKEFSRLRENGLYLNFNKYVYFYLGLV